jgi:membrane-bound lytic murein transglycosylase F
MRKRPIPGTAGAVSVAISMLITASATALGNSQPARAADSIAAPAKPARLSTRMAADFRKHVRTRLPALRPHFEAAAQDTGFDWKLLAALGYQESRWLPRAQSPAGAQGVMMLMPDTAAKMHVTDPLDAQQSIAGGARYLALMKRKIPKRITDPDRTWLALAAYNIGLGHLENARVITDMRGQNPDRWSHVRENLPRLSDPRWHSRFALGYARGEETAQLVERVFQFATLLDSIEKELAAPAESR